MPTHADNPAGQAPALESAIPALERLESLIADTSAAQVTALQNASPMLERMEEVLAAARTEQIAGLHKFEADPSLGRLAKLAERQRTEFDALDFIGQLRLDSGRGLWGWEEFHSGVLAWLLDPKQSHGLGDCFVKHFLLLAGVGPADRSADWSTTEVIREWENVVDGQLGYLDILIVNQTEGVLCAIENKVFSSEHSEQLTRYRKALEHDLLDFHQTPRVLDAVGHPSFPRGREGTLDISYLRCGLRHRPTDSGERQQFNKRGCSRVLAPICNYA